MSAKAAPDIRPPGAIDAAWLTAVLRTGGVEAEVADFTAKPIGTGQIGDSVRFTLNYRGDPGPAPASLVGKFPAAGEVSRQTGVALGNYLREVRFYQHLAPTALVRTPRCWLADVDEATHDFVLMMDDLAPAEPGDQLRGVTLDQARAVMVEAGKLHASHWGDEGLHALPFVSGSRAAPASAVTNDSVAALWEGFKDRYRDRLERPWIEIGDRLTADYGAVADPGDHPRCLTHNDFRPDNMMFATPRGGAPVTVLDWQSYALGVGPTDVAYFLAGALAPETRRGAEDELLGLYHRTLVEHGVRDYDPERLRAAYAKGGYLLFLTAFFAAMIVNQTARGDDMFIQMLSSAAEHMIEHGALDA